MANTYTKDDNGLSDKVFLLNGNSITHVLETDNALNPVPSLSLMNQVNSDLNGRIDSLSGEVQNLSVANCIPDGGYILSSLSQEKGQLYYGTTKLLSSHVEGLSSFVDAKLHELSYFSDNSSNGIISTLKQEDGKICVGYKRIVSSDVDLLSNFVDSKIADIHQSISNDGNGIISSLIQKDGKVYIEFKSIMSSDIVGLKEYVGESIDSLDSEISAAANELVTAIRQENGKLVGVDSVKITDDFIRDTLSKSKISGLEDDLSNLSSNYVKKSGDTIRTLSVLQKDGDSDENYTKVMADGKGLKVYLDGNKRVIDISVFNGLKSISVNGTSLDSTLSSLSSGSYDDAKSYTDEKIRHLSCDTISSENKFIYSVSEKDGVITANCRGITDQDISNDSISQSKIRGLVRDLGNISSEYLRKDNFNGTLSSAFSNESGKQSFAYDSTNKVIFLNVQGKRMDVKVSDIIGTGMVKSVEVVEVGGEKYLRLVFNTPQSSSIDIKVRDLAQVYKKGDGIDINEQLCISADSTIARQSTIDNLNNTISFDSETGFAKILTKLLQSKGLISAESTILSTNHMAGLENLIASNIASNIATLFVDQISAENQLIYSVGEKNGKINAKCRNIGDSDFGTNLIQKTRVDGLTSDFDFLSTHYVRNYENGTIDGNLGVKNLSANKFEMYQKDPDGNFTDFTVDAQGIGFKSRNRTIQLELDDGINDISVNGYSLSSYIGGQSSAAIQECKSYTDGVSSYLNETLSVCVELSDSSPTGILSTYVIKQGGSQSGVPLMIPETSRKVFIDDQVCGVQDNVDLSIIKLPLSSYEISVVASTLLSNNLYVVESDYIDAFGQQICALTMGEGENEYYGIAATDTYVKEKVTNKLYNVGQQISNLILNKEKDDIEVGEIVDILSSLVQCLTEIR